MTDTQTNNDAPLSLYMKLWRSEKLFKHIQHYNGEG